MYQAVSQYFVSSSQILPSYYFRQLCGWQESSQRTLLCCYSQISAFAAIFRMSED